MDMYTATETSYKNGYNAGYAKGYEDGRADSKTATPEETLCRLLLHFIQNPDDKRPLPEILESVGVRIVETRELL